MSETRRIVAGNREIMTERATGVFSTDRPAQSRGSSTMRCPARTEYLTPLPPELRRALSITENALCALVELEHTPELLAAAVREAFVIVSADVQKHWPVV
jgi:hypothetical protein